MHNIVSVKRKATKYILGRPEKINLITYGKLYLFTLQCLYKAKNSYMIQKLVAYSLAVKMSLNY
jgi:hypothetical protein